MTKMAGKVNKGVILDGNGTIAKAVDETQKELSAQADNAPIIEATPQNRADIALQGMLAVARQLGLGFRPIINVWGYPDLQFYELPKEEKES